MFEEDLEELATADLLSAAAEFDRIQNRAAVRILESALVFADRHGEVYREPRPGYERIHVYGGDGCPGVAEFAPIEFGAVMRMSSGAAAALIGEALALRHRLPRIWAAVLAGNAVPWRARKIAHACLSLSQEAAAIVDRRVVGIVNTVTPGALKKIVTAALWEADPEAAKAQAEAAARTRGVFVAPSDEHGTKRIWVRAAAGDVIRFDATIDDLARALKTLGDTDNLNQRRAKAIGWISDPAAAHQLLEVARHLARTQPTAANTQPTRTQPADPRPAEAPLADARPTDAPSTATQPTTPQPTQTPQTQTPQTQTPQTHVTPDGAAEQDTTAADTTTPSTAESGSDSWDSHARDDGYNCADEVTYDGRDDTAYDATHNGGDGGAHDGWDDVACDATHKGGDSGAHDGWDDAAYDDAAYDGADDAAYGGADDAPYNGGDDRAYDGPGDVARDGGDGGDGFTRVVLAGALAARLAAIKREAHQNGLGAGSGRRSRHILYVHLTDRTLATGNGVLRVEELGPLLAGQLGELLGHDQIVVKPVIDLQDEVSVHSYEIPDWMRERVRLRHPVDMFPFSGAEATGRMDQDHIAPYDRAGPPGQTTGDNLIPLGRLHHRAKTFGGWRSRRLPSGAVAWTSPHGFRFVVDHTGTHPVSSATVAGDLEAAS